MSEQETTKTRTRKGSVEGATDEKAAKRQAEKAEQEKRAAERKAEQEAKAAERKEAQEKAKAEREAKRAEEKAAKDKERQEAKEAKEREAAEARQALVESGQLIERDLGEGRTMTFTVSVPKKDTVAQRAAEVIQRLMDSPDVPVSGKDLADEFGGGTVQWVAFFGMLRVMGYVRAYRYKTGERGEGGLAYLWTGPADLELIHSAADEQSGGEQAGD